MAHEDITLLFGGWPGFEIAEMAREPGGTRTGAPQLPRWRRSPAPATTAVAVGARRRRYEVKERRIRKLPIFDAETWLLVPLARVDCPHCGPRARRCRGSIATRG